MANTLKELLVDQFSSSLTPSMIILSLVVAFVCSLYIVYIYRKTYSGVVFNKNTILTIILLTVVTSMIIRTINSNLSLSLGMVGALSIVRFRTAIKEPVDTAFMFWAIASGIMSGAGIYVASIVGSLILGALFLGSYLLGFKTTNRYLLIIKYSQEANEKVKNIIKRLPKSKLKSKSIFKREIELTFEIDLKDKTDSSKSDIIDTFQDIEGITNVSLISYQNDFGE